MTKSALALSLLLFIFARTVYGQAEAPSPAPKVEAGSIGSGSADGGPTGNDSAGESLDADTKIQAGLDKMGEAFGDAMTAGSVQAPNLTAMQEAAARYIDSKSTCVSMQSKAAYACLEQLSPELASTTSKVNIAASAISGFAVTDACSNFSKIMDVAKAGMTAYTAACGTMKAGCGYSCVKSRDGLTNLMEISKKTPIGNSFKCIPTNPADQSQIARCEAATKKYHMAYSEVVSNVQRELDPKQERSIAGKASLCTGKYAELALSAVAGIASLVNSIKQGQKCEEESSASDVASNTVPTDLAVKCVMAEYKETVECKCYYNPRLQGCANGLEKAGANAGNDSGFGSNNSDFSARDPAADIDMGSLGGLGDPLAPPKGGESSPGMAGAPVGGGSAGLGGGGGGGGGPSGGDGGGSHKGLNTDILSGSGGGGGGGWGGRGGGSASGSGSKYRSYLPGGANDPNKMSGQSASKEVTGQGGKSNWEKVRDRYRDNNTTLLNN
ncbi:hypothetical protein D3C87_88440 [compost metagenome]